MMWVTGRKIFAEPPVDARSDTSQRTKYPHQGLRCPPYRCELRHKCERLCRGTRALMGERGIHGARSSTNLILGPASRRPRIPLPQSRVRFPKLGEKWPLTDGGPFLS